MADKPEFVDMISEATRQVAAPHDRRVVVDPVASRKHRVSVTGRRIVGAVADGDVHAVEAQILEIQELGLSAILSPLKSFPFRCKSEQGSRFLF